MSTKLRPAAVLAAALCAGSLLAGCSLLGGPSDPARDAETGEIVEGSDTDVFAIRVGDCLGDTNLETDLESVPTVPCGEPHRSEIYASFQLADGDYPGVEAAAAEAEVLCLGAFEEFVGVAYDDSLLYATTITPTAESWERVDDREVLCIVYDPDVEVTGTLRGANR